MKKSAVVLIFLIFAQYANSQRPAGTPITEIYTNFHYSIDDTAKTTGFGVERAFFGYRFPAVNNFSAAVIVNIGAPEELADGAKPRRLAHFREAFISYSKEKLTINLGLTKTMMADYQQKFLGKRYITDNLTSMRGYGYVSDLGLSVLYRFSDLVNADFELMNGKGYSDIQNDNNIKASAGLYIMTPENLAFRVFGDITRRKGLIQSTMIGFAGFKNDLITFGAEISYKRNLGLMAGYNAWGFSATGSFYISDKTDIFGRYDISSSVSTGNDPEGWNYLKDSNILITGIEYSFTEKIKAALNYQGNFPHNTSKKSSDFIFLNCLYRF